MLMTVCKFALTWVLLFLEVSGSLTVSSSHPLTVQNADSGETLQIVATDAQGNIVTSGTCVNVLCDSMLNVWSSLSYWVYSVQCY